MADFLDRLVARARQTPRRASPLISDTSPSLEVAATKVAPTPTPSPVIAVERAAHTSPVPPPPAVSPILTPSIERQPTATPATHLTVVEHAATPVRQADPITAEPVMPTPPTATPVEIERSAPTLTVTRTERTEHTERHVVDQVVATPAPTPPASPQPEEARPPTPPAVVSARPLPVLPATPVAPPALAPIAVPAAPAPEVHVHIGRVDIRGPEPQPTARSEAPTVRPEPPKVLSLGEYLHGRRSDAMGGH